MTQVFRHEVVFFVDAPNRARKHCGPLLVDVFHIQVHGEFSSLERCVSVFVCVWVCKRGFYPPDAGETYHWHWYNASQTLSRVLFLTLLLRQRVQSVLPLRTRPQEPDQVWLRHKLLVCVCVLRKRARAEEWKEAWRGVIAVVRASGAVGHRDDVRRGGSGLSCVI